MSARVDLNRHGIRRTTDQKTPQMRRQCTVPWVKIGEGVKNKRNFKSKKAAERFITEHSYCKGMSAYRCANHGWHIGHERKAKPRKYVWGKPWGRGYLLTAAIDRHLLLRRFF